MSERNRQLLGSLVYLVVVAVVLRYGFDAPSWGVCATELILGALIFRVRW